MCNLKLQRQEVLRRWFKKLRLRFINILQKYIVKMFPTLKMFSKIIEFATCPEVHGLQYNIVYDSISFTPIL